MMSLLAEELHETLKQVEKDVGAETVLLKDKEVRTFCQLINDDNYDGKHVPPGYVMNLTNRVIQKIFIQIGPLFISKIKGLIHVSSKVEFFNLLLLEKTYLVVINTSQPVKKVGKNGTYYSIIFTTRVMDDAKEKTFAIDEHEFFFKL